MKNYFPLNIDLSGRLVVVIGAGKVALRKIKTLLKFQASILLVSREIREKDILKLVSEKKIRMVKGKPDFKKIKGAFMVIAASDNERLNDEIAAEFISKKILVNNASGSGSAIFPAFYKNGGLTVSVSTSGASPSLSVRLRDEIAGSFGKKYSQVLEILKEYREKAKNEIKNPVKREQFCRGISGIKIANKNFRKGSFRAKVAEMLKKYSADKSFL